MRTAGYQLLDSGMGNKLERVGPYLLVRPSPQAVWSPSLPKKRWQEADAVYIRSSTGGGKWEFRRRLPEKWEIEYGGFRFAVKPTGFGHLGLFPEQIDSWEWISEKVKTAKREITVLNLFAYTGGSTLAAASAGASVCHLDASKGVVDWGRENAALSNLSGQSIRWIVDDAYKFVQREARRGSTYDGFVLDPPRFGRGTKGEVWKIEDDLPKLLTALRPLLSPSVRFILINAYTADLSSTVISRLLSDLTGTLGGTHTSGELALRDSSNNQLLPNGIFARWSAL